MAGGVAMKANPVRSVLIACAEGNGDPLALGATLAGQLEAKPIAVHVLPWPDYMLGDDAGLAFERRAERAFLLARELLPDLETRVIHSHSVVEGLIESANQDPDAVIVVGAGDRRWDWLWPSSVPASMLDRSRAALAIAPRGYPATARGEIGRAGIVVDGSNSQRAVAAGAAIARRLNAPISLFISDPRHVGGGPGQSQLLAAAGLGGVQLEQRTIEGPFVNGLLAACHDLDLVVVGPRRGWRRRKFRRSVADHLIRKASCPVLVITDNAFESAARLRPTAESG